MQPPRIIGGELRGRAIQTPKGLSTRPLRTRVRRSLFDILADEVPGSTFLDLFAGAGSVGFEAASRGAARVVLVENARPAQTAIHRSIETFRLAGRVMLRPASAAAYVASPADGPFDLVFVGAPYRCFTGEERGELYAVLDRLHALVTPTATLVIESPPGVETPAVAGLTPVDSRIYGETALHFLEPTSDTPQAERSTGRS